MEEKTNQMTGTTRLIPIRKMSNWIYYDIRAYYNNYQRVSLLYVSGKIFARIL